MKENEREKQRMKEKNKEFCGSIWILGNSWHISSMTFDFWSYYFSSKLISPMNDM